MVRIRLLMIPQITFQKIEAIDCAWRLARLSRKLFDAYLLLGKQAMDYVTQNLPVCAEEIDQIRQQIDQLLMEQERIEAEQTVLNKTSLSQKD